MSSLPGHIVLTEFEQALLEQIDFSSEPGTLVSTASGRASRQLMESLDRREAIPAARRAYFTQPFPGGRGKSHLQEFQSKLQGTKKHVFEDPCFVRNHLRYFINGPDLPPETIESFCHFARQGDADGLRRFVREASRKTGVDRRHLAEEFYKLALECFPGDPLLPRRIRDAAAQVR